MFGGGVRYSVAVVSESLGTASAALATASTAMAARTPGSGGIGRSASGCSDAVLRHLAPPLLGAIRTVERSCTSICVSRPLWGSEGIADADEHADLPIGVVVLYSDSRCAGRVASDR
jgi:hypothetical protein